MAGLSPSARYDVTYRTTIQYDDIVHGSQNELRACPASDEHQRVLAYEVAVHPGARVLAHRDYWGTRVDTFGVREPHVALEVTATSSVEVAPRPPVTVSPRLEELRRPEFLDAHGELVVRSPHVAWDADVAAVAERLVSTTGDDVVGIVLALHRFVHTSLDYVPGATYIGVDVNHVLSEARGVCQDYAHLAVALCRSAGIPARYVSGYFFAASETDPTGTTGDDVRVQTHAWFEAAIPGWGWWALDPTNGQQVGSRHIKIGHGRDYDDVAPLRGIYLGSGLPVTDAVVGIRRHADVLQLQSQQQ